MLTAQKNTSEDDYLRAAAEKKVKVYGLSDSMVAQATGKATILLGFGGLKEDEIIDGVNLLKEAWMNTME